jgi:anti-sigma-K factor RskA
VLIDGDLDARIERYLDGELPADEVARLERELLEPEVARALSEALMLRELLGETGPAEPPAYLVGDILVAVSADSAGPERAGIAPERARWGRVRAVLSAVAVVAGGSAMGFAGMAAGAPALAAVGRAGGAALLGGIGAAREAFASREAPQAAAPRRGTKALSLLRRWLARRRDR